MNKTKHGFCCCYYTESELMTFLINVETHDTYQLHGANTFNGYVESPFIWCLDYQNIFKIIDTFTANA